MPLLPAAFLTIMLIGAGSEAQGASGDSLSPGIAVRAGWNLLSLPVDAADGAKNTLFPSAVSNAFVYDNGYVEADTLRDGRGFWLKFPAPETVRIGGAGLFNDTIPLHAGWNLIGGISTNVAAAMARSVPAGIIVSGYYGFIPDTGYLRFDTLRPGMGYMVKSSRAGSLLLRSLAVPCPGLPVVEYGGMTYHTVQIADQCWLRENLDIGTQTWGGLDQSDDGVIEKYCFIDDPYYCSKFGGLYQWNEAMGYTDTAGARGICPEGWHIPTLPEFRMLDTVTGGDGNQLKALRQGYLDGAGTNVTGFTALLAGYRHLDGSFSILGYQSYFWTSTGQSPDLASSLYLFYNHSDLYFYTINKGYGFSIRCLRD